jgi:hypothetical protein
MTLADLFWADLIERFWKKVEKTEGCWLWQGARTPNGYGKIKVGGRDLSAHRVSWELEYGLRESGIPEGMQVCHHCDNRACVRPDHLFLGSQSDNTSDMWEKGRGPETFRTGHGRGEQHGCSRLTEAQVLEARHLYGLGEHRLVDLAAKYGVGVSTIHDAVSGKKWKHLPLAGAPAVVQAR